MVSSRRLEQMSDKNRQKNLADYPTGSELSCVTPTYMSWNRICSRSNSLGISARSMNESMAPVEGRLYDLKQVLFRISTLRSVRFKYSEVDIRPRYSA